VRPAERPVHLLALDEASAHHLVDCRFDERSADRFPLLVPLAVVWDRFLIVVNVSLELRHARRRSLGRCRVIPNQIEVQEQLGQPLKSFLHIAVPQQMFGALQLL